MAAHSAWDRTSTIRKKRRSIASRSTVSGWTAHRSPIGSSGSSCAATGHVTVAELVPDPKDYPGMLPHMIYAGSLTFAPPNHPVSLRDFSQWWTFTQRGGLAASVWSEEQHQRSRPPSRRARGLQRCACLCALGGKDLPTEAEWEFAARGGLDGAEFAWGDEFVPGGCHMANTWQGEFPRQNLVDRWI